MTRLVSSPRVVTQTPAAVMSNLLAVQAPPWRWLQCWMALGRPTRTYKLRGRSHSTSCVSRSIISTFSLNASLQSLPPVVGFVCNFQSFDSLATKLLPSLSAILISFPLSINENEVRYSRHNLRCDCLRSQPGSPAERPRQKQGWQQRRCCCRCRSCRRSGRGSCHWSRHREHGCSWSCPEGTRYAGVQGGWRCPWKRVPHLPQQW